MTPESTALMAEYNRWMNHRIYNAALQLPSSEVTKDRGAFFGSLLQTLNHIAVGDTIWLHRFSQLSGEDELRSRLTAFPMPTSLRQELAHSLPALHAYRSTLDEIILTWARSLTAEQLGKRLSYTNMAGEDQSKSFAALVQHFFNHQTHHRGQASTLLSQAGVDVGVTDLLAVIPNDA